MNKKGTLICICFVLTTIQSFGQDSLRYWAEKLDKTVGSAVEGYFFENGFWEATGRNYNKILTGQFNGIVAGNEMKMDAIHPQIDTYNFTKGDILVEVAEEYNMLARGHTLLWHNQNPSWFVNGEFTRDSLLKIMEDHITTIVTHYKGRIHEWDVLNEIIEGDGSLRKNKWQQVIGDDYIDSALVYAHRADPDALLFINDYGIEVRNSKSDGLYDLVEHLLENDIPLHGVGLQCHFTVDRINFSSMRSNMERFNDLGLLTNLTELDIRIHKDDFFSPAVLAQQAEDYGEILSIMLKNDLCTSLLVWGFSDNDSWIPSFTGQEYGQACIYNLLYQPKPAYHAMLDTLKRYNGVVPQPTGVYTSQGIESMKVMPNPVKEHLIIRSEAGRHTFSTVEIYSLTGTRIKSFSHISTNQEVPVKRIPSGIYLIRIMDRNGNQHQLKIVKH